MNEQLKNELLKYSDTLLNYIKQSADFAKEQAPLVVQEYLRWSLGEAILYVLGGLVLFLFGYSLLRAGFKQDEEDPGIYFGGIAIVISLLIICCNVHQALYIYLAPRVFLLETFANFVKSIH